MCFSNQHRFDDARKSERQRLEEALGRPSVTQHEYCADGKIIIAAARKYLDTLPKPKWKVRIFMQDNVYSGYEFNSFAEAQTHMLAFPEAQKFEIVQVFK